MISCQHTHQVVELNADCLELVIVLEELDNQQPPYGDPKDDPAFREAMKRAWQNGKTPQDAVREYLNQ